jgi:hypothetical protein
MNSTPADLERTSFVELPSGERVRLHSQVGPGSGPVLQQAVQRLNAQLGCDVGLASCVSNLYILDGLENIRQARYASRCEFHEEES